MNPGLSLTGFLHYAKVSVGTPPLSFIVALDTGSSLFWLPCNCNECLRNFTTESGVELNFNIYIPSFSSSSNIFSCDSPLCGHERPCPSAHYGCPYKFDYLDGSSSRGLLVSDILHLATYDRQPKSIEAAITFGCGSELTGGFLYNSCVNGLFGLALGNRDVLSILASKGIVGNSFSLCFPFDGYGNGRLVFGDNGSLDQGETPLDLTPRRYDGYYVWITQVAVNENVLNVQFTASFDSGTSFTYLSDPAYSFITENFNSLIKEPRHRQFDFVFTDIFEYCYDLSPNQTSVWTPPLNLTMKGGNQFHVFTPTLMLTEGGRSIYCFAIIKSNDNIIGQNFMPGYSLVFDREKFVLRWKQSHCKPNQFNISTYPVDQQSSAKALLPVLTRLVVVSLVYSLVLHIT